VAVAIAARLGAPSILGYLIAGVVLGPKGFGLTHATEGTRFLAELGVVLLMFMVGLEFPLHTLWSARRMVLGAGFVQVLLTAGGLRPGCWALACRYPPRWCWAVRPPCRRRPSP
jgi:Kef-type K+ transport system membrane component KefB